MRKLKHLSLVFVMGLILIVVAGFEISPDLPTYMYYGRVMPPDEVIARAESGRYLHCVQQITDNLIINNQTDLVVCFDTAAEAEQNARDIAPDVQRYNEVHPPSEPSSVASTIELSADGGVSTQSSCIFNGTWQLYAHSFQQWLLATLCNGQSVSGLNAVWSTSRHGNPNFISLCHLDNLMGQCHIRSVPDNTMVFQPLGPGGSRSAKVN